jgi:hypothetical protein
MQPGPTTCWTGPGRVIRRPWCYPLDKGSFSTKLGDTLRTVPLQSEPRVRFGQRGRIILQSRPNTETGGEFIFLPAR